MGERQLGVLVEETAGRDQVPRHGGGVPRVEAAQRSAHRRVEVGGIGPLRDLGPAGTTLDVIPWRAGASLLPGGALARLGTAVPVGRALAGVAALGAALLPGRGALAPVASGSAVLPLSPLTAGALRTVPAGMLGTIASRAALLPGRTAPAPVAAGTAVLPLTTLAAGTLGTIATGTLGTVATGTAVLPLSPLTAGALRTIAAGARRAIASRAALLPGRAALTPVPAGT
ncbi:hypothetical protein, partial [Modestobacter marinus]|uniref:hypothetical protein n=1 Tax=Modestobacter marinus TaxID=477641 RepID=UPI001C94111E